MPDDKSKRGGKPKKAEAPSVELREVAKEIVKKAAPAAAVAPPNEKAMLRDLGRELRNQMAHGDDLQLGKSIWAFVQARK